MAFQVEDGTGLEDANAYVSVAFFNSFHGDRGRNVSSFSSTLKEQAIVRATDYLDKRFGRRFRGFRLNQAQNLEWPRLSAFDNDDFLFDAIPRQLQWACSEYALITLRDGELLPNPPLPAPSQDVDDGEQVTGTDTEVSSGIVTSISQRVGPIAESKTFANISAVHTGQRSLQSALVNGFWIPEYPVADLWIEELLKSSMSRVLRRG